MRTHLGLLRDEEKAVAHIEHALDETGLGQDGIDETTMNILY